ncbi:MAG: hypothetical protein ACJ8R9_05150 [Steroidobacteraceae bacterium]
MVSASVVPRCSKLLREDPGTRIAKHGLFLASERTLRVLIADDHPVMLDGLRYMIQPEPDLEVVAEAKAD